MAMRLDIRGIIVPNDDKFAYDFLGIESTCPKEVHDLTAQARGEPLDIHINSGGGDLIAGLDMYAELRQYRGDVNIHISYAASAAGIVACAGKSDMVAPGLFMVHNVSAGFAGDYHDMDKGSEILRKANEAVAAAYVEKSGMTYEAALEMMDTETWLTANEAVAHGLVDCVVAGAPQLIASQHGLLSRDTIHAIRANNQMCGQSDAYMRRAQAEYKYLTLKGAKGV